MHTGSWSLVNCLAGSLYEALYKVLMNINGAAVGLTDGLGHGDRCIRVIPRQIETKDYMTFSYSLSMPCILYKGD